MNYPRIPRCDRAAGNTAFERAAKMIKKDYPTLKLKQIKPYKDNPRKNDEAAKDVQESISQCGYIANIVVDESGIILAGHTRYKALKKLGVTEIEVERVTGLTEELKKKYRLLDNKVGEKALWDFESLDKELQGLDFEDFDFGFNNFTIEDIQEVDSYDENNNDNEYFTAALTFPIEKKSQILAYLRKHKKEIVQEIINNSGD